MHTDVQLRNRWERMLGVFARLSPGEGLSVFFFMAYGFLVMFSYYMLKTLREPLLLSEASAENKSYAYAVIALVLLFIVPAYGALYRKLPKRKLSLWISCILLAVQAVFFLFSLTSINIGFAYYVWVGIFGVLITAQFWAFATDSYNVKAGQRVFPLIMIGVSLGGLVGPAVAGRLLQTLGAQELMLIVLVVLAMILPLAARSQHAIPESSRTHLPRPSSSNTPMLGGFSLILGNRYLLMIAVLVVLLNWVNTTGEYILAELVISHADALVAQDPGLDKGRIIGGFYGNFFSTVNALSLLMQMFVVSRVISWIGVHGALLILPVIALIGYGLMVFIPIFSVIRIVKMAENPTDYSLMNTARHALFLPLNASEKYQSKIAIDGFFWRFGDLLQAVAVFVGVNSFGFEANHFAIMNMVLALFWVGLAVLIGRHYQHLRKLVTTGEPPRLLVQLQPHRVAPGSAVEYRLPANLFYCEPGDILDISMRPIDSDSLPDWLQFNTESLQFGGAVPDGLDENTWITVRATNMDGQWAETRLGFLHL